MTYRSKIIMILLAFSFLFVLAGVSQLQANEKVTCPVSGKEIKNVETAPKYEYKGKTYYFCCENCKKAFIKNPEKYVQKKEVMAEKHMHEHMEMHEHKKSEEKACCAMMGLMSSGNIEMNVENMEGGVAVKITSKNAEVVKKIQEHAAKMKEICSKKEAKEETEKNNHTCATKKKEKK